MSLAKVCGLERDRGTCLGISTRDPKAAANPQARGVSGRLGTYRQGRLTSDFGVAVALRFVVPELTQEQVAGLAAGELRRPAIQALTREWIADAVELTARSAPVDLARKAETVARVRGIGGSLPPLLNPLGT